MEIRKGMYGLTQARIIFHTQLKINLPPFGYKPCGYILGLWEYETRYTKLCLVFDTFGIKCTSDHNLQHILSYLQKNYNIGGYERRYILQDHFKMGLQQTHSLTQHAWLCPTCTRTFPTLPPLWENWYPPTNGKNLYMGSKDNTPTILIPHLSSFNKRKRITNKFLKYFCIMNEQWILLFSQNWTQ